MAHRTTAKAKAPAAPGANSELDVEDNKPVAMVSALSNTDWQEFDRPKQHSAREAGHLARAAVGLGAILTILSNDDTEQICINTEGNIDDAEVLSQNIRTGLFSAGLALAESLQEGLSR